MKARHYGIALLAGGLSYSTNASDKATFIASIAYQDKKLTFDQQYSGTQSNSADFSVHIPVINFSLTTAYKKFFAAVKLEKNFSTTSTTTTETDRSADGEINLIALQGSDVDVSREDVSLTLGYNAWRTLNLFIGYLNGETELTPDPFCADLVLPIDADDIARGQVSCTRTNRAGFQFFLGDQGFYNSQPEYRQTYSEDGPYIGASYSFRFQELGTLSLSFAYADMEGEYKDNANDPDAIFNVDGEASFLPFNYRGDTRGTSIGITWTGSLGDTTAYSLDVRRQAYSMDGSDKTGAANLQGVKLETDEEMLGISAGVQFYF